MPKSEWNRYNGIFHTLTTNRCIPIFLLSVICLRLYLPELLGHEFVNWDDPEYILNNSLVNGLTLAHVIESFTKPFFSNYAPFHLISYMIDFHLWGEWSQGYLLENLIIHLINGLLLFMILIRLTGSKIGAFLGSLLFLIHPVQIESVAWASERKNVLSMLFFLMAFHFYLNYDRSGWEKGWSAYLLSLLMFGCAVLTKSIAVIFPAFLLLFDLTSGRDSLRNWKLLEKIPFFALAIGCIVMTLIAQDPHLNQGVGGLYDIFNGDRVSAFLTMTTVFFTYIRMLVIPSGLSILYDPPIKVGFDPSVVASIAGLVALVAIYGFIWKKDRGLVLWGGVFILALLPVSQIIPLLTLINDRYLYFPMVGIAGIIATCYSKVPQECQMIRLFSVIVLLLFAAYLFNASSDRLAVWKNSLTLWSDAAVKSPALPEVWLQLGVAYKEKGQFEFGRNAMNKAITMIPKSYTPLYELARLEAKAGRTEHAVTLLEKAVRMGYKDRSALDKEDDFTSIRKNPAFVNLYKYFHLLRLVPGYRMQGR